MQLVTHELDESDALELECVTASLMRRSSFMRWVLRWMPKTESGVELSCSERTLGLAGRLGVLRAWSVLKRLVAVPVQSPVSPRRPVSALTRGLAERAAATSACDRPRAGAAEVAQCWRSAKRETGVVRAVVSARASTVASQR